MADAEYPPYMNGFSYIEKVLTAIKPVPAPPKFTQDFLATKLGIKSTSARPIIPFLKKIGFLTESGAPTNRYRTFRNSSYSGAMVRDGLLEGYSKLYEFNEYAHELSETEVEDLVVQATNCQKGRTSKAVTKSFFSLKSLADFSASKDAVDQYNENDHESLQVVKHNPKQSHNDQSNLNGRTSSGIGMNLSYTINLNLPETTNSEVFDAIFQSLNRNILKPDG